MIVRLQLPSYFSAFRKMLAASYSNTAPNSLIAVSANVQIFIFGISSLHRRALQSTDRRVVGAQEVANFLEGVLMDANRFVDLLIPRLLIRTVTLCPAARSRSISS